MDDYKKFLTGIFVTCARVIVIVSDDGPPHQSSPLMELGEVVELYNQGHDVSEWATMFSRN